MKSISEIDAKNRLGQLLDEVQRGPVTVTKEGRPSAILLSVKDYERIRSAALRRLLATVEQTQEKAAANGMTEDALAQLLAGES